MMKKRKFPTLYLISLVVMLLLVATACNLGQQATDNVEDQVALAVAQTQTALAGGTTSGDSTVPSIAPQATQPPPTQSAQDPTATPTLTSTPITPTPTQQLDCDNKASLIDETIEDGSEFPPGYAFEKSWILRNDGTCTWTTDYAFEFVEGDQMGAVSPQNLAAAVAPGEEITITVNMTSPGPSGSHESKWMLRAPEGTQFGVGAEGTGTVWAKITVNPKAGDEDIKLDGPPAWIDSFEDNSNAWFLDNDGTTVYDIENGSMMMKTLKTTGELWRIATTPKLSDVYIEATVRTGDTCSGKDGYGLIVRSSSQKEAYYDSGYVFVITCEGTFRVYRMAEAEYKGLENWKSGSSILTGANKTNKVGVLVKGNNIKVYVNRVLLGEYSDSTYSEGKFGLLIRSENTPEFEVFVEDIAYWFQ